MKRKKEPKEPKEPKEKKKERKKERKKESREERIFLRGAVDLIFSYFLTYVFFITLFGYNTIIFVPS